MNTLQHILVLLWQTLEQQNTQEKAIQVFREELPYVLLPDAIRMYGIPRQCCHFEKASFGNDVSWIEFPENIKDINRESILDLKKYLSENILPCHIGEQTRIEMFIEHNQHLPQPNFRGILKHLIQDVEFDRFIREVIDCSQKYNNTYTYKGKSYNGEEIRNVISDIQAYGVFVLMQILYKQYSIIINQEWIDSTVKSVLYECYPQDMAENTCNYMKIDSKINIFNPDCNFIQKESDLYKSMSDMYKRTITEMICFV